MDIPTLLVLYLLKLQISVLRARMGYIKSSSINYHYLARRTGGEIIEIEIWHESDKILIYVVSLPTIGCMW